MVAASMTIVAPGESIAGEHVSVMAVEVGVVT
jgi:hypothetical protein